MGTAPLPDAVEAMFGARTSATQRLLWRGLVLALAGLAIAVVALIGAYHIWSQARVAEWQQKKHELLRAVGRAQPLIDALDAYRNHHAQYPQSLNDLVPNHLGTLPAPGPPFRGAWQYNRDPDSTGNFGVYDLFAEVPPDYCPIASPVLHFSDHMSCRSDRTYPREAHGGVLERIGEWGYYHE